MQPVVLGDRFGWMHESEGSHAALICGSIGFEKLCYHRSLRLLSTLLCEAGFSTLRFDYSGTGDSIGSETDPHRVETWIDDIVEAVAWLRARTGAPKVALVGIHLGALLALAASQRLRDVDQLVLLAPVLSGRAYVRGLQILGSVHQDREAVADGCVEAAGLRLHPSSVAELKALSGGGVEIGAPHVLVLTPAGQPAVAPQLKSGVGQVVEREFAGYPSMHRDAHLSVPPHDDFQAVAAWLRDTAAPSLPHPPPPASTEAILRFEDGYETPLHFEAQGRALFGLHTHASARAKIGLLICNTGGNAHYGFGRFAADLARRVARDGIDALRFDLAGIGDSQGPSIPAPLYDLEHQSEVRAAIDVFAAKGYRHIVAFGICSGAYHALHAALADERVTGLVLVNQVKYASRDGRLTDRLRRLKARLSKRVASGFDAPTARDLKTALWHRGRQTAFRMKAKLGLALDAMRVPNTLAPLQSHFRALSARGVRTLLIVGRNDLSRVLLEGHAGADGGDLRRIPDLRVEIDEVFDHSLGQFSARKAVSDLVTDYLAALPAR